MIDASFVAAIEENSKPVVLTLAGKEYSSAQLFNPPQPVEPTYPAITMCSLDSFLDFIKANEGPLKTAEAFALCDEEAVLLHSKPNGENRKRDCFVKAEAGVIPFQFGQYVSLEDLRISLLTQFVDSVFRVQVLTFLSKVTDSNVKTSEDDGVSQTVTAKAGIASYGNATVPSPVRLQPIRTFAEVEQPEGVFLLRLLPVKDALPKAGLFELHTNWKRAAALSVKAYLDSKECPLPVFA